MRVDGPRPKSRYYGDESSRGGGHRYHHGDESSRGGGRKYHGDDS